MRNGLVPALLVAASVLSAPAASNAVEERSDSVALYGFGAFLDGDMTFGERSASIDVDPGNVIDSLEMAAFARYRHQTDRWAFVFDGQFAGLGDTRERGAVKTDLDLDLYLFQADAAYRFSDTAEALFGVRYVRLEAAAEVRRPAGTASFDTDASFWDPVIGLRTLRPLGEKLRLQAQGDIGGGANMDFTWQGMVHLGYQLNDSASIWLGYRGIGMEFDDGGGHNRLDADIVMHGPEAGIVFQF